jgi:UDP:flavonoid glycosyltransferase YjiC (YdhE family)
LNNPEVIAMARILLTWELGSGLGHVANLASIAKALRQRGHQVVAALRDPAAFQSFFEPLGVATIAAPRPAIPANRDPLSIATYADMLSSVGFHSTDVIGSTLDGWDRIYDDVQPDCVVYDHSPFALLAAMGCHFAKLQHSTGFCIPPDVAPLPPLRPWLLKSPNEASEREQRLLQTINAVLTERNRAPLVRLADLFYSTDENWLATYEELDHFGSRLAASSAWSSTAKSEHAVATCKAASSACLLDTCYQGITPPPSEGVRPAWPTARGPKVFAYLQPDATTLPLIGALGKLGFPTIARVAGLQPTREFDRYRATLRVMSDAVDVTKISQECDLAVLSGGHGTLSAILLAGKPVVIAPLQLEQLMLARCCEKEKLALASPTVHVRYFVDAVTKVATDQTYHRAARAFAERYRSLDCYDQLAALTDRIEQLSQCR